MQGPEGRLWHFVTPWASSRHCLDVVRCTDLGLGRITPPGWLEPSWTDFIPDSSFLLPHETQFGYDWTHHYKIPPQFRRLLPLPRKHGQDAKETGCPMSGPVLGLRLWPHLPEHSACCPGSGQARLMEICPPPPNLPSSPSSPPTSRRIKTQFQENQGRRDGAS